jgi:hypothetical protein
MKSMILIALATFMLTIGSARADTDLIYGPGGYLNSLSRVQSKGSPSEQRHAACEAEWLNANQAHVNQLMEWLRTSNRLRGQGQ